MPYIDFHAHIAPGIDHGSADLGHSLTQLDAARNAGVGVIVASSHFYISDGISPADFVAARNGALDELRRASPEGPRLVPAAEVHLTHGLSELDGLELLRIGSSDMILIEMPYGVPDPWSYDELLAISARGLHIVIAHVDRYPRGCVDNLARLGFDMQVNADAASSFFGLRRVMPHIRSGSVKALGSDVHEQPKKSYAAFARAAKKLSQYNLPYLFDGETRLSNVQQS